MRRLQRRIERLEYADLRRQCDEAIQDARADPLRPITNVTPDLLFAEIHRVFRLSDAEQREYFSHFYSELDAQESAEFDAIRRRYTTIVRGMR